MNQEMPATWLRDPRLVIQSGEELVVAEGGLQPFLMKSSAGTLVMQSQLPGDSYPSKRKVTHHRLGTFVSRDGGKSWDRLDYRPGENEANKEGGALELSDGTTIILDTYVTPPFDGAADKGIGMLWETKDDWRTIQGPYDITFDLPGINFFAGTDDSGRASGALKLHRNIVALPSGDLLTSLYGHMQGDTAPCTYIPSMKKTRCMLLRSADKGRHWTYISTIAADSGVGTEGFDEAVLARLSIGALAGRLICHMRTGRELYEAHSDDDGATWSNPRPLQFGGVIDIRRTELWRDKFAGQTTFRFRNNDREFPLYLEGAFVDPDLLELQNGVLVSAFGVRIPDRGCWSDPTHPWNGTFLAFSFDQGQSWSHVVAMTSGEMTTHYTAIIETEPNTLHVVYDKGVWGIEEGQRVCARTLRLHFTGPLPSDGVDFLRSEATK